MTDHLQNTLLKQVSKSLDQIRSELFAEIESVQDEYAAKGWLPRRLNLNKGIVRGILELFCWGIWQLYKLLEAILMQAFPLWATGIWQDIHSKQIGNDRKAATKARGYVDFYRATGTSGNIRIPAGRIVRTLPDGIGNIYRYVTSEDAVLPVGAASVGVLVESEQYGALANASMGQISEIVTPVDGIGTVSNTADWIIEEGANAETDAEMQRRYALSWEALAGVTRAKYKAVALSVAGVVDVAIDDQHPRGEGTIDIIIKGSAGLPTAKLLADVTAALAGEIIINDDALVKSPTAVPITISAHLELLSGSDSATRLQAENYIRDVFSGTNPLVAGIAIGEDVIRDRLASGIITIPGLKRIVWGGSVAAGDVAIRTDELAILSAITVTSEWVVEP